MVHLITVKKGGVITQMGEFEVTGKNWDEKNRGSTPVPGTVYRLAETTENLSPAHRPLVLPNHSFRSMSVGGGFFVQVLGNPAIQAERVGIVWA
jgi:hypothetical protein